MNSIDNQNQLDQSTSGLNQVIKENESNIEINQKNKYRSKLITCLFLFIIPILGPILFLCLIKPVDKMIKVFCYISLIPGLNIIFLFFLLGFYKDEFCNKI